MQHELNIPYRRLFDRLDEGFAILQKIKRPGGQVDFKIVDANPVFATFGGAQVGDLIGKSCLDTFPRDSPQRISTYEAVQRTGVPARFERACAPGRTIDCYAFRIEDEPPYRIAVLGKDITDRKTAEHALRDNEQFLRNILDSAPEYIAVLDLEGRVEYWNEAARATHPTATAQHIGQNWLDLWNDPEERATAEQAQSSAIAGQPSRFEGHITTDDGSIRWWEVLLSSILSPSGRPNQLLALAREITGHKAAEQNLERVAQELKRSNADLTQYSHIVAHDLLEPVRTVQNLLSFVEERRKEDQDTNRMIVSATDRMGRLVQSLLDYAKAGHAQLQTETVSVSDVVDTVKGILAPLITGTGAEVTYDSLPTLEADRVQMEQLFQNLISNAIKFRRDGVPPVIRITAEAGESGWQFAVTDNGKGIPQEIQKSIFEPLKRFAKNEVPGSGLGLAVSRTIVERHGGSIWVDSEPNQRSTFRFTLPAIEPHDFRQTKREVA